MADGHIVALSSYIKVLVALLGLTLLTVIVAKPVSGFDLGFLNIIIAMVIASVKAGLVLTIFMHLKYSSKVYIAAILTSVFALILMWSLSYIDIISRAAEKSTL